MSLIAFAPSTDALSESRLVLTGVTDNQGNAALSKRLLTTKYPLCVIWMEAAAQLLSRKMRLRLEWRRRDLNQTADDLTNGEWDAFDPAKRIRVPLKDFKGIVFKELMQEGAAFNAELEALKRKRAGQPPVKRRKANLAAW